MELKIRIIFSFSVQDIQTLEPSWSKRFNVFGRIPEEMDHPDGPSHFCLLQLAKLPLLKHKVGQFLLQRLNLSGSQDVSYNHLVDSNV